MQFRLYHYPCIYMDTWRIVVEGFSNLLPKNFPAGCLHQTDIHFGTSTICDNDWMLPKYSWIRQMFQHIAKFAPCVAARTPAWCVPNHTSWGVTELHHVSRQPPQLNYLPATVLTFRIHGTKWDLKKNRGGISLAVRLASDLPPMLNRFIFSSIASCSKASRGLFV